MGVWFAVCYKGGGWAGSFGGGWIVLLFGCKVKMRAGHNHLTRLGKVCIVEDKWRGASSRDLGKLTVPTPPLDSNREPLFGKGDYAVQNSPVTEKDTAFPFSTDPSTLNPQKIPRTSPSTKKGGVSNFRSKRAPKCVAVRVLQKVVHFTLL